MTPPRPFDPSDEDDSSYGGQELESRHIIFFHSVVKSIYYAVQTFFHPFFFFWRQFGALPGWFAVHSNTLKWADSINLMSWSDMQMRDLPLVQLIGVASSFFSRVYFGEFSVHTFSDLTMSTTHRAETLGVDHWMYRRIC